MNLCKAGLLSLYYHGTLSVRRQYVARLAREGRAPIVVLFYHRIADDRANPWTVSNKMFARQIGWLQKNVELVSLAEAQHRIANGVNPRTCVSITFDDGYADNCDQALPLLIRKQVPCTYFVSTENVVTGKPFPHDVALGKPSKPNTISQLRALADAGIEIGGHTRTHADLGRITDPDQLHDELVTAGRNLADAINHPVRYFAFPYGQHANLSVAAFKLARESGYKAVCSAYGGYNFPGDDPFHIQRVHVDNDLIRLKNWVTFDPRKLRMTKRFEYGISSTSTIPILAGN